MSSLPTPDLVSKLREAVTRRQSMYEKMCQFDREMKAAQRGGEQAREGYDKAHRDVLQGLAAMDCAETGNIGWQNRMAAMLVEFHQQAFQEGIAVAGKAVVV